MVTAGSTASMLGSAASLATAAARSETAAQVRASSSETDELYSRGMPVRCARLWMSCWLVPSRKSTTRMPAW